jgi:hypothetical protein
VLGLRIKNMRQIAANLRDAEKCLALTQQKGGGRHAPVYLPNVAQLKALAASSNTTSSTYPTLMPADQQYSAIESATTHEQEGQLSTVDGDESRALAQHTPEDTALGGMPMFIGPQRISKTAHAPSDPPAAAVAASLVKAGLADASTSTAMVRSRIKNLPKLSAGYCHHLCDRVLACKCFSPVSLVHSVALASCLSNMSLHTTST